MDPITCLSVAGAAVQFLDFALEIVKEGRELYKDGKSNAHAEAAFVIEELLKFTTTLGQNLYLVNAASSSLSADELALEKLCKECNVQAKEF